MENLVNNVENLVNISESQENTFQKDMESFDWKNFGWSKSSINTLLRCPKTFHFQYVKKVKGSPNSAMVKGSKIHAILEQLNQNKLCVDNVPPQFKMHVLNYIDFLKTYKLALPLFSEKKYETEFDGIKLKGIVDAVHVQGNEAIIIDYKSGRQSGNLDNYRFELQLYSYLIEKNLNLKVIKYGILFTANKLFLVEGNDHKYVDIAINLNKIKNIIERKEYRQRNFDQVCNMCQFKEFCIVRK